MLDIPQRISALLAKNHSLNSYVLRAVALIGPWAKDNKMVFFPEYTDHSLTHLNEVIATADSLISDESWEVLTPEDAAVLIVSVLMHDCALHLTEDGFFSLLDGTYVSPETKYISPEIKWSDLWVNFLAEAKRFDQRKLKALFGDSEPISDLPANKLSFTLRHRLLIGEFLRRHHARLAHEIALNGIPGPNSPLSPSIDVSKDFIDLCGFVARSHNLTLRKAVDALDPQKRRVHLNCHVPFLMALLRISDYIQIHSARAPQQLLQLKTLVSPVSRDEWRKHGSIVEIHQAHDDPEAIFVDAEPPDANTFIAMQKLLADIQNELDQSWAVIGEIYGRLAPLNKLGINIRRVRSSLDDSNEYERTKKPNYVPQMFKFRTASGELMDLLVAPLYGQKPEIGIRELIQNAIDACIERDDLIAKGIVPKCDAPIDDVIVTLEYQKNGTAKIILEDFGVGMTLEVINNYFLNIGASFRSSDLWRKNHEIDGHSSVHRTGRFGIGILAAYLLGDEMEITTSHISDTLNSGYHFLCRRGDENIEIQPCKFRHGTKIEIVLRPDVAEKLRKATSKWDWYCLEKPRVVRRIINGSDQTLGQKYTVPNCDADLDGTPWRRLEADNFDDLMWSFEALGAPNYYSRPLICNGIFVTDSLYKVRPEISPELNLIQVTAPSLVVFDPDGRLPINLQRNSIIADKLPFQSEYSFQISRYITQSIVDKVAGLKSGINESTVKYSIDPGIKGFRENINGQVIPGSIILREDGVLPADLTLLSLFQPTSILIDPTNSNNQSGAWRSEIVRKLAENYLPVDSLTATKTSRTAFIRKSIDNIGSDGYLGSAPISGRRILLRKSDVTELISPGNVPKSLWRQLRLEFENEVWGLWKIGNVELLDINFPELVLQLENSKAFGFSILYLDWEKTSNSKSPDQSAFAKAWLEHVHSPVLKWK